MHISVTISGRPTARPNTLLISVFTLYILYQRHLIRRNGINRIPRSSLVHSFTQLGFGLISHSPDFIFYLPNSPQVASSQFFSRLLRLAVFNTNIYATGHVSPHSFFHLCNSEFFLRIMFFPVIIFIPVALSPYSHTSTFLSIIPSPHSPSRFFAFDRPGGVAYLPSSHTYSHSFLLTRLPLMDPFIHCAHTHFSHLSSFDCPACNWTSCTCCTSAALFFLLLSMHSSSPKSLMLFSFVFFSFSFSLFL